VVNTTILDVAVGLIFGVLAISLATSTVVAAVASVTKRPANTLLTGIKQMVNDLGFDALAKSLYEYASIDPRGRSGAAPEAEQACL
jgi:hypothetical protein